MLYAFYKKTAVDDDPSTALGRFFQYFSVMAFYADMPLRLPEIAVISASRISFSAYLLAASAAKDGFRTFLGALFRFVPSHSIFHIFTMPEEFQS